MPWLHELPVCIWSVWWLHCFLSQTDQIRTMRTWNARRIRRKTTASPIPHHEPNLLHRAHWAFCSGSPEFGSVRWFLLHRRLFCTFLNCLSWKYQIRSISLVVLVCLKCNKCAHKHIIPQLKAGKSFRFFQETKQNSPQMYYVQYLLCHIRLTSLLQSREKLQVTIRCLGEVSFCLFVQLLMGVFLMWLM